MDIRRILLPVPTYPDRAPDGTLESAFRLAEILGATITAQVPQLDSDQATWPAVMGAFPVNFPHMMQELVTVSELNAAASCGALEKLSSEYNVTLDLRRSLTTLYPVSSTTVDLARLHDLLILPIPEISSFDRSWVEAAIFQSGRPVVLMPSDGKSVQSIDRVVVAWDYSREAARALSDALPILRHAREVQMVTVFGEKHIETTCVTADIDKFLAARQIRNNLCQLDAGGEPIADLIQNHARAIGASMLVMGCYGHSRALEFLLGGASRGIIRHPSLPV